LFIDTNPDTNLDVSAYTSNTYQVLFGMPTNKFPKIYTRTGSAGKSLDIDSIKSATTLVENGYEVEIEIPFKNFVDFKPVSGSIIGFDIAIDDNDVTTRKIQLVWNGEGDNFANRFNFGRLLLK
jgi:hypothetical protein